MIKTVIRSALVATLAVGVLGFTATGRAEEKEKKADRKAEHKKSDMLHGEIESVDLKAGTVTIKSKKESMTFVVNADTDLVGMGKETKLADLRVGDKVNVNFKPDSTPLTATKIGHLDMKPKGKKTDDAK